MKQSDIKENRTYESAKGDRRHVERIALVGGGSIYKRVKWREWATDRRGSMLLQSFAHWAKKEVPEATP